MFLKDMTRSLLIAGLYMAAAFAADTNNISQNSSSTVQAVEAVAGITAAPPAAETGPFGLPSLSDLPGLGWLGSRPSSGRGGNRNPQQANNRKVWQPRVGQPFQIILSSSVVLQNGQSQSRTPLSDMTPQTAQKLFQLVPERVDIFDIDLWDNSAETVEKLHASGKKVICYFSAGTSEDWRVDFKNIRPQDMGASLPLWKGERWLDIRKRSVWTVMQKRIELASKRGCDAIDPDNIDVYDNEKGGGFRRPLTKRDSIIYVRKLAREARRYGLSIGLKNSGDILKAVQDNIQFAVNEECAELEECNIYKDFLYPKERNKLPKAVFHIEYVSKQAKSTKEAAPNTTTPKEIPIAPAPPKDTTPRAPFDARSTTTNPSIKSTDTETIRSNAGISEGPSNGIADLYDIFNKLWPNASTPLIRKNLCLGTPPTGIGSRMSTVIKELSLGGWVMYCDGGTADTRTLLPNGQTPKKGAGDGGKGAPLRDTVAKGRGGRNRLNSTGLEFSSESENGSSSSVDVGESADTVDSSDGWAQEDVEVVEGEAGEAGVGQDDPDLLATIVNNPGTEGVDDVWNSDVGPILEEDLKPNPEKKSKGAGKDRRGPDGYAKSSASGKERRAVVYFS